MARSFSGRKRDNGGVVDLDYEDKAPYAVTGHLKKVVFDLQPRRPPGRAGTAPPNVDAGGRPRRIRLTDGSSSESRLRCDHCVSTTLAGVVDRPNSTSTHSGSKPIGSTGGVVHTT